MADYTYDGYHTNNKKTPHQTPKGSAWRSRRPMHRPHLPRYPCTETLRMLNIISYAKLDAAPLPITEKLGVLGRVVYDDRCTAIGSKFTHHNLHTTN